LDGLQGIRNLAGQSWHLRWYGFLDEVIAEIPQLFRACSTDSQCFPRFSFGGLDKWNPQTINKFFVAHLTFHLNPILCHKVIFFFLKSLFP